MSSFTELHAGLQPFPGYRLQQLIGRGGFACVWEVEGPDGDPLALKFIRASDRLAAAEEIRSIQRIRQLEHPHLIRLKQVWCHPGYIVIAMELAEGSLLDLLEAYQEELGRPIPRQQVLGYLAQAAATIDFLNTRQHDLSGQRVGYQHCDVKPNNLLFQNHRVKLCDFGLASATTGPLQTHRRAGTVNYAAPEVFQGRLSNATDQYALAVAYCQLRGGRLPFADSPDGFRRSYRRPVPDLTMLPIEERLIVARALAEVPQQRWPSCREMIARLERVSSSCGSDHRPERHPPPALAGQSGEIGKG